MTLFFASCSAATVTRLLKIGIMWIIILTLNILTLCAEMSEFFSSTGISIFVLFHLYITSVNMKSV